MKQWLWYGVGVISLLAVMLVRWRRMGRVEPPASETESESSDSK